MKLHPLISNLGSFMAAAVRGSDICDAAQVMEEIVQRTADAMVSEGAPFRGVLFAGLMIKNGRAKLLEHNVRFGDPECQGLMMRLQSDLLEVLLAACDGRLADVELDWSPEVRRPHELSRVGLLHHLVEGSIDLMYCARRDA